MRSAALPFARLSRTLLIAACALGTATLVFATAAAPVRSAPSRPNASALPTKKIRERDHVNLADAAVRLGLKHRWIERGAKAALSGESTRAEIERSTRDIIVNGVRVFLGDPVVEMGGELYVSRIDFERCLTPMLRPGHGVPAPAPPKTIVLDPGHGGKDQGTSVHEKTYALDVAKRVQKRLEAAGYRVVLTRDDDIYLPLQQRPAIANASKADLFVSIHFNALPKDTRTSGVEIYTFAPQFQRSTGAWGLGEKNDVEEEAAPGNRFDHWNVALAHAIHRRFITDLKTFDRGKKLMHLGVLRSLNCPGVLVECGFLSSEAEARKIATAVYRQQIADTLAAGIRDYAATIQTLRSKASTATSSRPVASTRHP